MIRKYNYQRLHCNATFPTSFYVLIVSNKHLAFFNNARVDVGNASRFNRWLIRREASKTDLILTRTQKAAERLKKWGVKAPIEVTADNAFAFQPNPQDHDLLKRVWPEASHVVGVAAEDIYVWPVQIRLWDRKEYC
jgi:polysaccharide pyruvyl transferase WcaK-like protein